MRSVDAVLQFHQLDSVNWMTEALCVHSGRLCYKKTRNTFPLGSLCYSLFLDSCFVD